MNGLRQLLLGKPRDPLSKDTRRHIVLIAFFAWVALGADGLSSSCYGPEQAFYALGTHYHLCLFLAIATTVTIFLISSAYNQVIRLFPNGGGGYKVASVLLGPRAGLVSGMALIIDYMLTIAISIASGADALFSLFGADTQHYKLLFEITVLFILLFFNLRGVKESLKILLPIFVGFFLTHLAIIIYGIVAHAHSLPMVVHDSIQDTKSSAHLFGWVFTIALFMRAYSLGAGTYTGLEAVSNNVHILAEPRVKTGMLTMFYMALSLSLVAGGIIFLYLLWNVQPVDGQTLNAVVFSDILQHFTFGYHALIALLLFEAGILLIAANTGFLGGPAVLANMATDSWVPRGFSMLSSRLVTQNGILFFGLAALVILLATHGKVDLLVVLYSMNVFLTFSMSLAGLSCYWWKHRKTNPHWLFHLCLSSIALALCVVILCITLIAKFDLGGWVTVVFTLFAITCGLIIRQHYKRFDVLKEKLNETLKLPLKELQSPAPTLDVNKPTAVFLVKGVGSAMHAMLWVHRMFPHYFNNFIFISHGEVDIGSFGSEPALEKLQEKTDEVLRYLVTQAQLNGYAAEFYTSFGTDPVDHIFEMAEKINARYHNVIFFSSRYVYPRESWFTRLLHSDFTGNVQRRLYTLGVKMLILPLNLET